MRLPRKPQYVKVRLDADMAPDGPLRHGAWPHAKGVLTYHYFGKRPLGRGDRVCINEGEYEGCFGTVLGRSWRYSGYSYGVRRAHRKSVTVLVQVEKTTEFEVA
jgi:hypothetical protein